MTKRIFLLLIVLITVSVASAQSIRRDNTIYVDTIRGSICDTVPFVLDTITYGTVGTYVDTLADSTVRVVVVSQHFNDTATIFDTICSNGAYPFADTVYSDSGEYYFHIPTIFGCDSTIILHLMVHPIYDSTFYDTICMGDTSYFADTMFVEEGLHSLFATTYLGCDSISRLNLTFHPFHQVDFFDTICFGDTAFFFDSAFVDSGTYTFHALSQEGCDSISYFKLMVHPVYQDSTIFDTICQGTNYAFGDTTYSDSGFFQYNGYSVYHCDSVATLSLFVLSNSDTTIYDTIFEADLPWSILDTSFVDTVANLDLHTTNAVGCDSTIHYNLFVWWDPDHCEKYLQFPNLVTPNGDGTNDQFVIKGLVENQCFPTNYLVIYDRWGHRVFYAENISSLEDFWDPAKTRSPSGSYFFRFFGRGHHIFVDRKGAIEVLREP